jgi:diguanylate cyclase (GGDEF)-like protein
MPWAKAVVHYLSRPRVILAVMTAAILSFASLSATLTEHITRQMAVVSARDLGEMLAGWSRGPMERREWAGLNSLARLHSSNPGLRFVSFVVRDDTLPPGDKPFPTRAIQTVSSGQGVHHLKAGLPPWAVVAVPVYAPRNEYSPEAPRRLGDVILGIEPDRAYMLISKANTWIVSLSALLATLLVGLTVLLWRRFRTPVASLAAKADELVSANWGLPVENSGQSDIGKVRNALGMLAKELADRKSELQKLHGQVEDRVRERTELLRELASRDPLTGLHNRRYFSHAIEPAFEEAKRYGAPLTLVMIDLDDFKSVNDRHGHCVGDEVLIILATTLTTELRAADLGARFGGDEFVVLMPQTDLEDATTVIRRVRNVFVASCSRHFKGIRATLSIGLAGLGPGIEGPAELFAAADEAMYQAKKRGKNRICRRLPEKSGGSRIHASF